jgi:hypothetical protein
LADDEGIRVMVTVPPAAACAARGSRGRGGRAGAAPPVVTAVAAAAAAAARWVCAAAPAGPVHPSVAPVVTGGALNERVKEARGVTGPVCVFL